MLSTKLGRRVLLVFQGGKLWRRKVRVGKLGIFYIISNLLTWVGLWLTSGYVVKTGHQVLGLFGLWASLCCVLLTNEFGP